MKKNEIEYYNDVIEQKAFIDCMFFLGLFVMFFSCLIISIGAFFSQDDGGLEVGIICLIVTVAISYPTYRAFRKMRVSGLGFYYSKIFKESTEPFVSISDLTKKTVANYADLSEEQIVKLERKKLKDLNDAIKYGYILNCTVEFHNGIPVVALAKKVVKDKCQHCGAPIVGVYDESYVCQYCGVRIDEVIEKK